MTDVLVEVLPLGRQHLIPGVQYRVISEFVDDDRVLHLVGEHWRYEGLGRPKMYPGYVIHARDNNGGKMRFRLKQGSDVASNFEIYVVGPIVNSSELLRGLSDDGKAAFARVRRYLEPLPEFSDVLLELVEENKQAARIYSMKVDFSDSNAEQSANDLTKIGDELRLALREHRGF